ncbi:MAG: hypothetical protein Unbinned6437contig1000_68 [Prokaryotic dsDNA virus sp.]|nr:MAG: hypothetical protein Unbinned6437contig1000_68 [Prokaryotic dsDNA virus sp.]|tara:strand:+ start:6509 stop:6823 length:315 start_codon:yes stop_codon:yes gene_type:complete
MITVEKILIQDIAKAKFLDRFFYYILNYVELSCTGEIYMSINPFKWSIMTLLHATWFLVCYILIIPLVGIPCMLLDAYRMPSKYINSDFDGWYLNDVRLLRDIN